MSSKWGWATLVAVTGIFMLVGSAPAQQPGGPRPGGGFMRGRGGIMMLAGNEAVQKEIGVEAKDKEQLALLLQAFGEDVREQMQTLGGGGFQNATEEERAKMMAKMQEVNQKLLAKYVPELQKTLKPEQFKRLQEITWQAGGSQAFNDPDLVKALDLSKEQQDKIGAVNQEFQQKLRGLFGGGGGQNPQESFAKIRELNQERDKKAEEVLSKDQQEKFTKLKGKSFDLAQLRPPGGPGGGRPGGRPDGARKGAKKDGDKGDSNKKDDSNK